MLCIFFVSISKNPSSPIRQRRVFSGDRFISTIACSETETPFLPSAAMYISVCGASVQPEAVMTESAVTTIGLDASE